MKKSFLKGAALLILMLVMSMLSFANETKLVVDNPGFEEGKNGIPTYWSNVTGKEAPVGSFCQSSEKAHSGNYSLKLTKDESAGKTGVFSAGSFGVNEYRWYTASAMVYTDDTTMTPELYLEFYNVYGIRTAFYKVAGTKKGDWEKLTISAISPQGAIFARLMAYCDEGSYGSMYMDDVSLVKKDILTNGSFDNNVDGWEVLSGSAAANDGEMKLASGKVRTFLHHATSGVEYVFAGTVSEISGGKAYAAIQYYDSNSEELLEKRTEIVDGYFSVRCFTPLDGRAFTVSLEAEGEACFDNLYVTPANKGTQLPDGSFESMAADCTSPWSVDTVSTQAIPVPGGDFEADGWSISHSHTKANYSYDKKLTGSRSVKFSTTNGGGVRSPLIEVTPGKKYTAKMNYTADAEMQFYIEYWSDAPVDGSATNRMSVNLVRPAASSAWAQSEVSLTAPGGAKYVTMLIYYSAGGASLGERVAYADDVSIVDGDGNTIFSDGFEALPTAGEEWSMTNYQRGSFVKTVASKYSGNASAMLTTTGTGGGGTGMRSPLMEAKAGETYTFNTKYMTNNSTLYAYVEFWPDDTLTGRLNETRVNLPASSSWTDGTMTLVAPAKTKYMTVLYFFTLTEGGALAYIDDVTVETTEAKTLSAMTDEAICDDGQASLKLTSSGTSSLDIPALSGKNYVATVYAKSDITGGAEMTLTFHDESGNIIDSYTDITSGTSTERLVVRAVAPVLTFSAKVTLMANGTCLFDGAEIYVVEDTIANPSFENTDHRYGGHHATQWQSCGNIAALSYGDIDIDIPDGSLALEIYGTGSEGFVRSSMIRVTPKEEYTARIMAKVLEGNENSGVRIAFYDSEFKLISSGDLVTFDSDCWTIYEKTRKAPSDAAYATVEIISENGDHILVDDVEFSKKVTDIGNKHQLFIDDFLIADSRGITRKFHQGQKTEPIMGMAVSNEQAHESNGCYIYGTVLYDEQEEIYKMWYTSFDNTTFESSTAVACYATSEDGVNWEKPILNLVSYNGSTANNIIGSYHISSVIKDTSEPDPAKRYKMITYHLDGKYSTHYSADGLTWTRDTDFLIGADVVTASYDKTNEQFYTFAKINLFKRNQWTMTAKSIDNWNVPVMSNTVSDLIDTRLCYKADSYGMGLYERDGVYIGFNWSFYIPGTYGAEGVIEPTLAFSRDLTEEWQRPTREALIPLGKPGSIDDGMIFTASSAIEVGDEVWMYCGVWDGDHMTHERDANIYIAKWRMDGFASLDSADDGYIKTRPLVFDGAELYINADATDGEIRVELVDENGNTIDGYSSEECDVITGDSVRHSVSWNGNYDVSALSGKEISVVIYSENSSIYSFRFGEAKEERRSITIDIGEKSADTNVCYAEINGIQTQIAENNNTYSVEIGEKNQLVEITEKTSDGTFVKSQYFHVDVVNKTYTKLDMDSYMTTDGKKSVRTKDPMGIRFRYSALKSAKSEDEEFVIDEIGFIVAVTDNLGDTELTLDFSKYVTGVAYNKAENKDIVFDSNDEADVFTGVVKNIPISKYKTNLTCKTYTKMTVGGEQFVVYGEPTIGNIYDTAQKLLETDPNNAELIKIVLDADYSIGIDVGGLYE